MEVKVGQSLASTVDDTTVVVVRAPAGDAAITIGGAEVSAEKRAPGSGSGVPEGEAEPTQIGKRYVDEADTIELLVTKAGTGRLALGGAGLVVKSAKPLPSSD